MSRKDVDEYKEYITAILDAAKDDSNEWVQAMHEIVKDFPSQNILHSNLIDGTSRAAFQCRKALMDMDATGFHFETPCLHIVQSDAPIMCVVPMEAHYLNTSIITEMLTNAPRPTHFKLRKRPKPAAIASEAPKRVASAQGLTNH